ncbi:hypothetical protein PhaeoP83_02941 [Phaeobacter inhibens]|uniref:Uncharacterized protein n=1 Tax=Phaeobacter inhibens TaxID=221822 RepID=A0ABM6RHC8_9RHOB|nr:hypothetical protein PhaeoP83_02941 [Phaeobacter inhibens]AUQ95706.1 hypothetical protein PhaeoP66_02952 [Phaeobacter inhibens]AUR20992.1 hypothetical protein PhaeoP80_02941 [Phaeobacter inhibens]
MRLVSPSISIARFGVPVTSWPIRMIGRFVFRAVKANPSPSAIRFFAEAIPSTFLSTVVPKSEHPEGQNQNPGNQGRLHKTVPATN